jgi:hypothetical protein
MSSYSLKFVHASAEFSTHSVQNGTTSQPIDVDARDCNVYTIICSELSMIGVVIELLYATLDVFKTSSLLQFLVALVAICLLAFKLRGHEVPALTVDPPTGIPTSPKFYEMLTHKRL